MFGVNHQDLRLIVSDRHLARRVPDTSADAATLVDLVVVEELRGWPRAVGLGSWVLV